MKIYPGRHVVLELTYADGETERLELDIVPDAAADFERGFLGEGTPLARAILGKTAGSPVAYRQGDITRVRILEVKEAQHGAAEDRSAEREAKERKAAEDADRTSLMIYATSMNSKWGEYDPKVLEESEDEEQKD